MKRAFLKVCSLPVTPSLDIEGAEFQVLQTLPWDRVDIEVSSHRQAEHDDDVENDDDDTCPGDLPGDEPRGGGVPRHPAGGQEVHGGEGLRTGSHYRSGSFSFFFAITLHHLLQR